ncbi:hypothetical protein [Pectobacterium araliae]|uniref:hypothetical protein n=1 Tax=Pectobacterium araliae TaxID=3073862 RepID=UPI0021C4220D
MWCGDRGLCAYPPDMLGFVINTVVERLVPAERFPNTQRYSQRLKNLPSWQKVQDIESHTE